MGLLNGRGNLYEIPLARLGLPSKETGARWRVRARGQGDSDIFVSYRQGAVFGPLRALGPAVNTAAREYSPRISLNGKSFFFTSERGMPTEPRTQQWTAAEFEKASRSTRNGLGNIYWMNLEDALTGTR